MTKTYTVEMYKLDKRVRGGQRLSFKLDVVDVTLDEVERMYPSQTGYSVKIFETYVERKNLMSGETYLERYDTPWGCSPSSETFWSM
jgi:hypothetical protein